MPRMFAAVLASLSVLIASVRGLAFDLPLPHFIAYTTVVFLSFAYIGCCAGLLAQKVLSESEENYSKQRSGENVKKVGMAFAQRTR